MLVRSRPWREVLAATRSSRRSANLPQRRGTALRLEPLEARTLLNAGDLDLTFGMGGTVTTAFQGPVQSSLYAAAPEPDGTIVTLDNVTNGWGLSRHNPNGSLVTTFGTGGTLVGTVLPGGAQLLAIQGDGRIIVAGFAAAPSANPAPLGLARYNLDGSLDLSFGGSGVMISSFGDNRNEAMTIQPDGKIVVAFLASSPNQNELVRFNPDGSLDTSTKRYKRLFTLTMGYYAFRWTTGHGLGHSRTFR